MNIYAIYGSCAASFIELTLNTVEEVRDTNFSIRLWFSSGHLARFACYTNDGEPSLLVFQNEIMGYLKLYSVMYTRYNMYIDNLS